MNILTCEDEFEFPEVVTIVGTGPNGAQYYDIAGGEDTILLNRAVESGVRGWLWVCRDESLIKHDWFNEAWARLKMSYVFPMPVFCSEQIGKHRKSLYTYNFMNRPLNYDPVGAIYPGYVRGFGTAAGDAIQIAVQLGARKIILVGIDMQGDVHADGSAVDSNALNPDGRWIQRDALDALIEWVHKFEIIEDDKLAQQCTIYTLSDTALIQPHRISADEYREIINGKAETVNH